MKTLRTAWKTLQRLHRNEAGAVSLETILVSGAIALPILIFVLKFGWPKVREYFFTGLDNLGSESRKLTDNQ